MNTIRRERSLSSSSSSSGEYEGERALGYGNASYPTAGMSNLGISGNTYGTNPNVQLVGAGAYGSHPYSTATTTTTSSNLIHNPGVEFVSVGRNSHPHTSTFLPEADLASMATGFPVTTGIPAVTTVLPTTAHHHTALFGKSTVPSGNYATDSILHTGNVTRTTVPVNTLHNGSLPVISDLPSTSYPYGATNFHHHNNNNILPTTGLPLTTGLMGSNLHSTTGLPMTTGLMGSNLHSTTGLPLTNTGLPLTTSSLTTIPGGNSLVTGTDYVDPTQMTKSRRLRNKLSRKSRRNQALGGKNDGLHDTNKLGYPGQDLYTNPGLAGVETYREGPGNLLKHKTTNQTHYNEPILDRSGPGFTNGDLYDRPGFAGVETHHRGPIDKIASKIVGSMYTHEPTLDRVFVEPQSMGPIDKLAHKLVEHKHRQGGVTNVQPVINPTASTLINNPIGGATTTVTTTKIETIESLPHQGVFSKLKNKIKGHPVDPTLDDKAYANFTTNASTKF